MAVKHPKIRIFQKLKKLPLDKGLGYVHAKAQSISCNNKGSTAILLDTL